MSHEEADRDLAKQLAKKRVDLRQGHTDIVMTEKNSYMFADGKIVSTVKTPEEDARRVREYNRKHDDKR